MIFPEFFPGGGKRRHIAYLFQVADVTTLMDSTRAVEPELKFRAPTSGIKDFWLRNQHRNVFDSGSGTIWSITS